MRALTKDDIWDVEKITYVYANPTNPNEIDINDDQYVPLTTLVQIVTSKKEV